MLPPLKNFSPTIPNGRSFESKRPPSFPCLRGSPKIIFRTYATTPSEKKIKASPLSFFSPINSPHYMQRAKFASNSPAEDWKNKIVLIQEYVNLTPENKEFKVMQLFLNKFYRLRNIALPVIVDRADLEKSFQFVSACLQQEKINPINIILPNNPSEVDLIASISATLNAYFTHLDFKPGAKVQNLTEYYWNFALKQDYLVPFQSNREDLQAVIEMGLPYLDETTIYHEVGSGTGEGLIKVFCDSYKKKKIPGSIIGTDINPYSLESTKLLIDEAFGGINNIHLRYRNAVDPIHDVPLNFVPNVMVVGANRFFSILDPTILFSILKGLRSQMGGRGYLIPGITVNSKKNMEWMHELMLKSKPHQFSLEKFELGSLVYLKNPFADVMKSGNITEKELVDQLHKKTQLPKDQIDISKIVYQVYYDPESFKKAVEQHHFKFINSKIVKQKNHDEREVMLFAATH